MSEPEKKIRKQLAFDLPLETHNKIKAAAALRNITISLFMIRAVTDYLKKIER